MENNNNIDENNYENGSVEENFVPSTRVLPKENVKKNMEFNPETTCAICKNEEKKEKFFDKVKYEIQPGEDTSVTGPIYGLVKKEEHEGFWIQCESCMNWYHGKCVGVEEYEEALIDQYHCSDCEHNHGAGPSIMKKFVHDYRRDCDDVTQAGMPTQTGTRKFSEQLKAVIDPCIPECPENVIKTFANGYQFMSTFENEKVWTRPYRILSREGLGLQLPDENFDVDACVTIIGEKYMIDTIDVFKQYSYNMSLGRFRDKFKVPTEQRDRLYNILSLEFSETKLANYVSPPEIVRRLSWVHKFWPDMDMGDGMPSEVISMLGLSPSYEISVEHMHSKPKVSMFCLMGMQDSYTDFHIDFGGSSVWYHVFKGKKVFYVVEPTELNLKLFQAHQNSPKWSETFFGDVVTGAKSPSSIFKISVGQGETVFIPSGWIHAVWTPEDSIVFGGNFLHDLNVKMQLKIYEMEVGNNIDSRFMFPSFEITNWYAAQVLLKDLKEFNEGKEKAPGFMIDGLKAMQVSLQRWMNKDKANPKMTTHITFNNLLPQIKTELRKQAKITQPPNKLGKRVRSTNDLTSTTPKPTKKALSKSFGSDPNSPKRGRGRPRKDTSLKLSASTSALENVSGIQENFGLTNIDVFIPLQKNRFSKEINEPEEMLIEKEAIQVLQPRLDSNPNTSIDERFGLKNIEVFIPFREHTFSKRINEFEASDNGMPLGKKNQQEEMQEKVFVPMLNLLPEVSRTLEDEKTIEEMTTIHYTNDIILNEDDSNKNREIFEKSSHTNGIILNENFVENGTSLIENELEEGEILSPIKNNTNHINEENSIEDGELIENDEDFSNDTPPTPIYAPNKLFEKRQSFENEPMDEETIPFLTEQQIKDNSKNFEKEPSVETNSAPEENLKLTIKICRSISGESSSARVVNDPEEAALLTPKSIHDYKSKKREEKNPKEIKIGGVDLANMFGKRSSSGRKVKKAAWLAEAVSFEDDEEDSPTKNFMEKFTPAERKRVEFVEKIGIKEDRDYNEEEDDLGKTIPKKKKILKPSSLPAISKKAAIDATKSQKPKGTTPKQRLANKMKIRF